KDSPLASKAPNFIYASGIGRFLELIGIPASFGISFGLMAFTTFVYDTLDVCTRLGRYIFEELTGLRNWFGRLTGTILTAGIPLFFIFRTVLDGKGNPVPAWKTFWNLFGASNQLLAALALIGVTVWLMNTRRDSKVWMVSFLPAVFMFVVSDWSLIQTMTAGGSAVHPAVPFIAVVLIVLSAWVAIETCQAMFFKRRAVQE
ncbi:MAG: carbon starvation protein A, partial [Verrucomicrobia bacterium]|nr:carbon starvation protein A [Verrucomicrobiota bacterium]